MSRAFITIVRDPYHPLGKQFAIGSDGQIVKRSNVKSALLIAQTVPAETLEAFAEILRQVGDDTHAAIMNSYIPGTEDGAPFVILSIAEAGKRLGLPADDRTRLAGEHSVVIDGREYRAFLRIKENMAPSPWILFDRDVDMQTPAEFATQGLGEWRAEIADFIPGFNDVSFITVPSASSRVLHKGQAIGQATRQKLWDDHPIERYVPTSNTFRQIASLDIEIAFLQQSLVYVRNLHGFGAGPAEAERQIKRFQAPAKRYGTIAAEVIEQATEPFTHVFLQSGVGGLAAGLASYFWEYYGAARPRLISVEPKQADCLYQSALQGHASQASGDVSSLMAGLACGKASPLAWQIISLAVDDFLTIGDDEAVSAMRFLAAGSERDIPVVAGESGAAGLAGLLSIARSPAYSASIGLGTKSRVLLINTEGATAPLVYQQLVNQSAECVVERQIHWLTTNS